MHRSRHRIAHPRAARCHTCGTPIEIAIGFQLKPKRAVHREDEQRLDADKNGVPIKDARLFAETEVGPKRFEKIAGLVERDAADDVGESGTEKNGEQQAGSRKEEIPEGIPNWAFDVVSEFDGSAAQDEEPEHHHERKIKAAEAAGI